MKREIAATLASLYSLAGTPLLAKSSRTSLRLRPKPDERTSLIRKSLTEQSPLRSLTPPAVSYDYDWQLYSSEL